MKIHSLELGSDLPTVKQEFMQNFLGGRPSKIWNYLLTSTNDAIRLFFVPTNFLSRFYANLPFGAALQRLLRIQNPILRGNG